MKAMRTHVRRRRRGIATVEFAVLLPLLAFLFVIGLDFARLFYHYTTVTNCARNGAIYASGDPTKSVDTTGIQAAALADASDLAPAPTVSSKTASDATGNPVVRVTVNWTFHTVTSFPGVPSTVNLSRTVEMRVAQLLPKSS
jgi:Flp pilus assembly protein TadG